MSGPTTPGFIELHGGATSVRIVPAAGGRIASMVLAGREWLFTGDAEPGDDTGFGESFPTAGACTLPDAAGAYAGLELPDRGELWAAPATVDVRAGEDGQSATLAWRGLRMPYLFERELCVTPAGEVVMRYAATNTGQAPMPFLWLPHPVLPLTPQTRLDLPAGARVRVYAQNGIELGGPGAEHRWPLLQRGKKTVDFSAPDAVARRYACKLFLDARAGWAAVMESGARLEVAFDPGDVPNVGLWIVRRTRLPFARRGSRPMLAIGPCIGAPDSLADALDPAWQSAHWLQPGETRRWELVWRGK